MSIPYSRKFGEDLIWRFGSLEENCQINSANIKPRSVGRLAAQVPGMLCTVSVLQERFLYTLQRMQSRGFLSLSRKEIHVANKSMRYILTGPTRSKAVTPRSQAKYSEYTLEKVKMGRKRPS